MSILIKKAIILTQNKKREQLHGDIYIEDQDIIQVSKRPISTEADYKIDGNKKLILPGLINTHTHIPMTLLRGYSDDIILQEWLEQRVWPVEAQIDSKSVEIGTKLGLLEMISSGTTTFMDMYFFEDTIGKTAEKAEMRSFIGFAFIDFGTPEYNPEKLVPECERFVKRWKDHEIVKPVIAPHGVYTCGPENLQKSLEIANKHDALLHIHCSETREEVYNVQKKYKLRPVGVLKKYGLLCDKMVLAHCGWITKNEIGDIKNGGAKVSHCPVSNMKIATGGYAPIPEMLEANAIVSLGTDGAASNNTLDMFDTMKFCALVHKQHRWDPSILPAQTVLDFATIDGSRALGIGKKVGSIEEGKKADVIMIDLNKPHLTPQHDYVSHLVYAARGGDVCTTITNGKVLMLENKFLTLNYNKIIDNAEKCAKGLTC
ncbi:MAG: amidohydrolase [Thermoplasmatales archaeon]|nr:MAG: amidohydrolase [Thermoplasmatales archaeon]